MNVESKKSNTNEIAVFRTAYLNSLPHFQELYLEMMLADSESFLISSGQKDVGYFIKTQSNKLIEFYIVDEYLPHVESVFNFILHKHSIVSALCKTFDFLLLENCLENSKKHKIIGHLFRDTIKATSFPLPELSKRQATEDDYDFLLKQEGELYESPEELLHFINGRNIIMFYNENDLYGCGYLIRINDGWDYYDIGMWVNPKYRNRGIATGIISHLKQTCLFNNRIPICGCAYENLASKRSLEKNGFISKYKLVEFLFR